MYICRDLNIDLHVYSNICIQVGIHMVIICMVVWVALARGQEGMSYTYIYIYTYTHTHLSQERHKQPETTTNLRQALAQLGGVSSLGQPLASYDR